MVKKEPSVGSPAMLRSWGFILFSMDSREPPESNLKKGAFKFWQDHSNNNVKIDYRGRGKKMATVIV